MHHPIHSLTFLTSSKPHSLGQVVSKDYRRFLIYRVDTIYPDSLMNSSTDTGRRVKSIAERRDDRINQISISFLHPVSGFTVVIVICNW